MQGSGGGSAAGGTSLAALGFQVAGDVFKAEGQKAADTYKAERLEQAAQYGELAAVQTSGQLTQRLNQTLGNIDTLRASMHTDPTSPTGAAVRGQAETVGETERSIAVDNLIAQARQNESDASYMRWSADKAMLGGALSAGADIAKAGSQGAFSPLFRV